MTHPANARARGHAVVIGAGMAGLLAARVLSDHFGALTLIERDPLPTEPQPRKGVPQGNHVHGLLARGQQVLSYLFPDLVASLIAGGATPMDMGLDFHWHHFGTWKVRFDSGIRGMLFTRAYLEWHVAQCVRALPNVRVVSGSVDELVFDSDRKRVSGVCLRSQQDSPTTIEADLVVDASGRGSKTALWLEANGYSRPAESTVKVNVAYASRLYRAPPRKRDWKALLVSPRPPAKSIAAIFSVEDGRWLVTLGGRHGLQPPTDEAGYLEFARALPVPDVYQVLENAEPLTPILTHKFPTNLRRRYERLHAFPERLVVMGDAFCSFNPIYGQGMTVSALEAIELDRVLREGSDVALRQFHKRIAKIVDVAWRLTAGEDFRHAEAEGERPRGTAFLHWYTGRLHERCGRDSSLALAFYRVMHMLDAPATLFRPAIAARILRPHTVPGRRDRIEEIPSTAGTTSSGSAADVVF